MKKIILFIITAINLLSVAFLLVGTANAQPSTFRKVTYDQGGGGIQGYAVARTFDNNYMIAGEKDNLALLIKIDSAGNTLWGKQFGSGSNTQFNAIIPTNDSCFVMDGHANGNIFCMKVNATGDTLWSKAIVMGSNSDAYSVQQTIDGGYILCGIVTPSSAPPYSILLAVKLDSSGNISWTKEITCGNYENYAYSIKQTADSGYVLIGLMENKVASTFYDGTCLVKLSSTGAILWAYEYNPVSTGSTYGQDVMVTSNGLICYLVTNNDMAIMKTDFSGNVQWCKSTNIYSTTVINGAQSKLHYTTDKGYVIASVQYSYEPGYLSKFDSTGNVLWEEYLYMATSDVAESRDKGYLVIGNGPLMGVKTSTLSPQIGIIKTDSLGISHSQCANPDSPLTNTYAIGLTSVTCSVATGGSSIVQHPVVTNVILAEDTGCVASTGGIAESNINANDLKVYPDPVTDKLIIETTLQSVVEVFNIQDQLIKSLSTEAGNTTINVSALPAGMYFIEYKSKSGVGVRKFVKE